jgi:translocation and assembly module TamA
VRITGALSDELTTQVRGASLLVQQSTSEEAVSTQEVVGLAQADYQRVLAVLYEAGFFAPGLSITLDGAEAATLAPVGRDRPYRLAEIRIAPGKPFRFGTLRVEPLAEGTALPDAFAEGAPASLSPLRGAATAAVEGWRAVGHAKAAVAGQRVTARHEVAEVDAALTVAPGPRLRFGALEIPEGSDVRRSRIAQIAALPENEVYSPTELREATRRLQRTGAFRSVALIEDETPNADGTLDVTARITDAAPRRFGFGAELSTEEGLSITSFWLHRNFFGGAERLRVDAEIEGIGGNTGGTDYRLGARLTRPSTFDEDTDFYVEAELEQRDEPDFFVRQGTVEAGIERYVSENYSYRIGLGLNRANTRDAFGENQYTLVLLPTGATADYRDDIFDARTGTYFDAEITPFVAVSGADNGVLTTLDVRKYWTFGEESPLTFALRGQLGSLVGPELAVSPADFLFYSGGGGTVRGQDYQSLGVTLPSGARVGGRSFIGLSAEVRLRTSGALGYVGFVDAGYIGEESIPDGSGEWHSGAGVGLRYATPVGPIRVDLAVPTSGDDGDSSFQVYIGIGQSF